MGSEVAMILLSAGSICSMRWAACAAQTVRTPPVTARPPATPAIANMSRREIHPRMNRSLGMIAFEEARTGLSPCIFYPGKDTASGIYLQIGTGLAPVDCSLNECIGVGHC